MNIPRVTAQGTEELLRAVADLVPILQDDADELDRQVAFPSADIERLRGLGCLLAPVAPRDGGLGLGTDNAGWRGAARLLRLLGRGNLSIARIFEAHVNALRLISLYGTKRHIQCAAEAARDGHLFALWVTDGAEPLRIVGSLAHGHLVGGKNFCSAAGHATQAVVTATSGDQVHLLHLEVAPSRRPYKIGQPPQGMRATTTGRMDLGGIVVSKASVLGQPGDYLREPEFSTGAWRTCAALLGGLDALIDEMRTQLIARRRDSHPHQLARVGQALIAQETAALWVFRAARITDGPGQADGDRHAYVNLARIAVERACLDALQLVQRSLGLAAFVPPNPVERLSRDLATYLRQPAPDEALADAATWFMRHDPPPPDRSLA